MFGKVFASGVLASALSVGAASASTIDVTFQVPGNGFGDTPLQETVTISTPNDPQFNEGGLYDGNAPAGRFQLTGGSLGNFAAFCVELAQALQPSATYTMSSDLFAGRILDNIDRLFSSAYAGMDTSLEAAAFQVALWEIVHDDGISHDLTAGDVRFSGNDAVVAQASSYLGGLSAAQTGLYEITFLSHPESQDIVTARLASLANTDPGPPPVPLPASAAFLLAGLGGFAMMRRRR